MSGHLFFLLKTVNTIHFFQVYWYICFNEAIKISLISSFYYRFFSEHHPSEK